MKNLKLTVVIVLVCLVSRNVMFHINYSIRVLLPVWYIICLVVSVLRKGPDF